MSDPFIQVDTVGGLTIDRVSYRDLASCPGFTEAVEALRDEAELSLFSDGSKDIDHDTYNRLSDAGMLFAYVVKKDGWLVGFAILMKTSTPRRVGEFLVTDAMWSMPGTAAGRLLMLRMIRDKGSTPLFITTPVAGRLAASLESSKLFEKTHAVFASR